MAKYIFFFFFFLTSVLNITAQQPHSISGIVRDKNTGEVIENVAVALQGTRAGVMSDSLGRYQICHLQPRYYTLLVNFIGYRQESIHILVDKDVILDIDLTPTDVALNEIVVDATLSVRKNLTQAVSYSRSNIWDQPEPSFSKLLNIVPGVTTVNIGAGVAKPVVRGMSGNRVAVINKGIAQQNQQWGADHGMEVNQFDIESAEIYKGPNALLLGSGTTTAIDITTYGFKQKKDGFTGEAILWGATNNDQKGGALTAQWQRKKWFLRATYSYQDYADYRVSADKFDYQSEEFAIPHKRLENTAGKEQSFSGIVGYKEKNVTTYFNLSNNFQKNGLFHLEDDHDDHDEHDDEHGDEEAHTSHRDIGMPYATSNHLALTNNTEWKTASLRLLVNTGYQRNHRQEKSPFHPHYEGQIAPVGTEDTEVDFKLQTYSSNARLFLDEGKTWRKTIGASIEYQQNRVGGYEFFLPRYNQLSGGMSFVGGYKPSEKLLVEAGVRYDLANTKITGFYDQALAQHLLQEGVDEPMVSQLAQRAYGVDCNFGSFSGSVGATYSSNDNMTWKVNLGKSFRFPSANELAANGAHHAAFRYEIGNPDLKPEHGYTLDMSMHINDHSQFVFDLTPFFTYYSNFIYLQKANNTEAMLYEEQPYAYSQAKALFAGGEYTALWRFASDWEVSSNGSLVLNKNLDEHNPLPFTPPFTMKNELKYSKITHKKTKLEYYQFSVSHQWYADQNRVGAGEETTRGTNLFNLSASLDYRFGSKWLVRVNLQVQNLFDTRYLNHMSLYRRLNIPEPGRNIQLFVRVPFGG